MCQTQQCNAERYASCVYVDVPAVEDQFVTEPIISVEAVYQQLAEEELHTLFEQAISDRLLAISMRLKRISSPLSCLPYARSETTSHGMRLDGAEIVPATMLPETQQRTSLSLQWNAWRRCVILSSVALILISTGFDLMGVLVLHAR